MPRYAKPSAAARRANGTMPREAPVTDCGTAWVMSGMRDSPGMRRGGIHRIGKRNLKPGCWRDRQQGISHDLRDSGPADNAVTACCAIRAYYGASPLPALRRPAGHYAGTSSRTVGAERRWLICAGPTPEAWNNTDRGLGSSQSALSRPALRLGTDGSRWGADGWQLPGRLPPSRRRDHRRPDPALTSAAAGFGPGPFPDASLLAGAARIRLRPRRARHVQTTGFSRHAGAATTPDHRATIARESARKAVATT